MLGFGNDGLEGLYCEAFYLRHDPWILISMTGLRGCYDFDRE